MKNLTEDFEVAYISCSPGKSRAEKRHYCAAVENILFTKDSRYVAFPFPEGSHSIDILLRHFALITPSYRRCDGVVRPLRSACAFFGDVPAVAMSHSDTFEGCSSEDDFEKRLEQLRGIEEDPMSPSPGRFSRSSFGSLGRMPEEEGEVQIMTGAAKSPFDRGVFLPKRVQSFAKPTAESKAKLPRGFYAETGETGELIKVFKSEGPAEAAMADERGFGPTGFSAGKYIHIKLLSCWDEGEEPRIAETMKIPEMKSLRTKKEVRTLLYKKYRTLRRHIAILRLGIVGFRCHQDTLSFAPKKRNKVRVDWHLFEDTLVSPLRQFSLLRQPSMSPIMFEEDYVEKATEHITLIRNRRRARKARAVAPLSTLSNLRLDATPRPTLSSGGRSFISDRPVGFAQERLHVPKYVVFAFVCPNRAETERPAVEAAADHGSLNRDYVFVVEDRSATFAFAGFMNWNHLVHGEDLRMEKFKKKAVRKKGGFSIFGMKGHMKAISRAAESDGAFDALGMIQSTPGGRNIMSGGRKIEQREDGPWKVICDLVAEQQKTLVAVRRITEVSEDGIKKRLRKKRMDKFKRMSMARRKKRKRMSLVRLATGGAGAMFEESGGGPSVVMRDGEHSLVETEDPLDAVTEHDLDEGAESALYPFSFFVFTDRNPLTEDKLLEYLALHKKGVAPRGRALQKELEVHSEFAPHPSVIGIFKGYQGSDGDGSGPSSCEEDDDRSGSEGEVEVELKEKPVEGEAEASDEPASDDGDGIHLPGVTDAQSDPVPDADADKEKDKDPDTPSEPVPETAAGADVDAGAQKGGADAAVAEAEADVVAVEAVDIQMAMGEDEGEGEKKKKSADADDDDDSHSDSDTDNSDSSDDGGGGGLEEEEEELVTTGEPSAPTPPAEGGHEPSAPSPLGEDEPSAPLPVGVVAEPSAPEHEDDDDDDYPDDFAESEISTLTQGLLSDQVLHQDKLRTLGVSSLYPAPPPGWDPPPFANEKLIKGESMKYYSSNYWWSVMATFFYTIVHALRSRWFVFEIFLLFIKMSPLTIGLLIAYIFADLFVVFLLSNYCCVACCIWKRPPFDSVFEYVLAWENHFEKPVFKFFKIVSMLAVVGFGLGLHVALFTDAFATEDFRCVTCSLQYTNCSIGGYSFHEIPELLYGQGLFDGEVKVINCTASNEYNFEFIEYYKGMALGTVNLVILMFAIILYDGPACDYYVENLRKLRDRGIAFPRINITFGAAMTKETEVILSDVIAGLFLLRSRDEPCVSARLEGDESISHADLGYFEGMTPFDIGFLQYFFIDSLERRRDLQMSKEAAQHESCIEKAGVVFEQMGLSCRKSTCTCVGFMVLGLFLLVVIFIIVELLTVCTRFIFLNGTDEADMWSALHWTEGVVVGRFVTYLVIFCVFFLICFYVLVMLVLNGNEFDDLIKFHSDDDYVSAQYKLRWDEAILPLGGKARQRFLKAQARARRKNAKQLLSRRIVDFFSCKSFCSYLGNYCEGSLLSGVCEIVTLLVVTGMTTLIIIFLYLLGFGLILFFFAGGLVVGTIMFFCYVCTDASAQKCKDQIRCRDQEECCSKLLMACFVCPFFVPVYLLKTCSGFCFSKLLEKCLAVSLDDRHGAMDHRLAARLIAYNFVCVAGFQKRMKLRYGVKKAKKKKVVKALPRILRMSKKKKDALVRDMLDHNYRYHLFQAALKIKASIDKSNFAKSEGVEKDTMVYVEFSDRLDLEVEKKVEGFARAQHALGHWFAEVLLDTDLPDGTDVEFDANASSPKLRPDPDSGKPGATLVDGASSGPKDDLQVKAPQVVSRVVQKPGEAVTTGPKIVSQVVREEPGMPVGTGGAEVAELPPAGPQGGDEGENEGEHGEEEEEEEEGSDD